MFVEGGKLVGLFIDWPWFILLRVAKKDNNLAAKVVGFSFSLRAGQSVSKTRSANKLERERAKNSFKLTNTYGDVRIGISRATLWYFGRELGIAELIGGCFG